MAGVHEYAELPEKMKKIALVVENLVSQQRIDAAIQFKPNADDVCLASGVKSGTTWTQQILHGLRSRGDMDFEEIDDVIVNLEFGDGTEALRQPQRFAPRMYKTHLEYDVCPKGFAKYVCVTRNPKDAAVSFYWHCRGWVFPEDEVSLEEFVDCWVAGEVPEMYAGFNARQLKHQASWYPHRKDPNVLWLHYEDLHVDLKECIRLISEFLGIGVGDQELLEIVERQAGFEFMKQHWSKFMERPMKAQRNAAAGLSDNAGLLETNGKVRNGKIGGWKETLSKEMAEAIDKRWRSLFASIADYDSYEEMRAAINAELGRNFAH